MRASFLSTLTLAALCASALPSSAGAQSAAVGGTAKTGGVVGLDVMTSTVFQENQSSFSGLATRLRVRNAAFVSNIEMLPTVEYWQNTSHLDAFGIETRRRDATLGFDVRWMFAPRGWQPYGGAGYSLHFLDDELRAPRYGTPKATSGVVKGGFDVLGGADFNMGGKLGTFVELKLLDVTRYRQVKFNTGLGWRF